MALDMLNDTPLIHEPLAIIGMSCQFPGIDADVENVHAFYEMLRHGQTPIKDVPKNRWDIDAYYSTDRKKADKIITRKGGFLNNTALFDPDFFKLSSVETKQIDPQHRLFLEVAIRALNHANLRLDSLSGSNTGVYCGISSQDYSQLNFKDNVQFNAYTQIGVASSASVGRLCHFLNLKGPSMVVDTACSSSLSALYLAATALRTKQCHLALVGGVHLNLCPENFIGLSKANMLSATGKCSSFDKTADGFARSEGCGVVIVKRLSDAMNDHDTIHAVIKSIVMNQDGDGTSLVAPNIEAQIAMHQAALKEANITASDIDYIETHGTGTVTGDTVEFNAIQQVHQSHHSNDNPLIIGALKSTIGHTIASSGIASLIKVIGALNHECIPPNLNYSTPNPTIHPERIPAVFPIEPIPFIKQKNKKRRVHISNFGFSGTNVGVIIEEPPKIAVQGSTMSHDEPQCFVISANSEASLKQMIRHYIPFLEQSSASLYDICATLINSRDHYKYRCAIIAADKKTLLKKIESEDYALKKVTLTKEIKTVPNEAHQIYECYLSGANIKLTLQNNTHYTNVDLPLYAFDRQSYWHEPRQPKQQPLMATSKNEPIAIIGMSCRFPKAANMDAFLSLLKNGESGMVDIPLERWDNEKYYSADMNAPGRLYIKQLGLLDNIKNFDAEFFNISPREAKLMSPQLRILLETSYHALEHANLPLNSIKTTNTGVFIGCERNDYPYVLINQGLSLEDLDLYFATGNALSALPGRVAYVFDFQGPVQLVDTACSSSITAIHNACLSLQANDCDMALAGGINILLNPATNILLSKAKMLSPDSRCKTFSEDADGYGRSEGCGIIVLKRLSTAIRDKDTIHAVIKGSAINSDGKSDGFTVPNGHAQETVIRSALAKSNLSPNEIDYIEAHGTGTPVADPIEISTLTKIFSEHHNNNKPLYVSSVKTNIGHCESASGMASIIKTVLSLQTRTLFKHLNFKKLNPAIQLENIIIPLTNMDWHKEHELRCAGVNSFGFSGANAHVVLQEAPLIKKDVRTPPDESLLVLSAKNRTSLELLLRRYQTYLANTDEVFADICYTAAISRNHFLFRVAIKAKTAQQAATIIENNEYTIHQIKKEKESAEQLHDLDQLQTAYQHGLMIHWSDFYQSLNTPFEKVILPLYEFTRTEYWFENKQKLNTVSSNQPQPTQAQHQKPTVIKKLSDWLKHYLDISDDKKGEACKHLLLGMSQKIQELPETTQLDVDASFFDIGFDSLMLTEMAFMLQETLEPTLKITVYIAFDYPSINKLATYIKEALENTFIHQQEDTPASTIAEDSIAIIGMSCSLPNAPDIAAFEALLEQGLSGIKDIPIERWDNRHYYDPNPDAPRKSYVNHLGLIDNIKAFDANFFGISPREATLMEPQQRLFLECCYQALEHANYRAEALRGSLTGVFAGVSTNEYYAQLEKSGFSDEELTMYSITGNVLNLVSGRVAYVFDFKGPSISIDTACSSSLVAIHYACQSLKNREIDYALAGGVNVLLMPESNITLCKAKALSPSGQCKTFDTAADGFARGEGCGVILLKRLSDAIRDKDSILAVIKASAINSDGKSAGLTVPNGKSQEDVMRKALSQTALSSHDISYIEAHGTGTPLGDPIEVHAINSVYGHQRQADNPLYMGSVKTNIGHLESASGIASIIKTVIALQKNKIYKHLNFNTLNPNISIDDTRIALQTTNWRSDSNRKYAGVNAFGFSGTNAHAILQDYPSHHRNTPINKAIKPYLLVLSAKSKRALDQLVARYQTYLETTNDHFGDICFTAATCRDHHPYRLAVIATSAASASRMIDAGQFALSHGENNTLALAQDTTLHRLCTDYLRGTTVDWSLYYDTSDDEFIKIALPHYAFDRSEFWPDKKREALTHDHSIHPLLGQMLSMPANEYLFNHTLDLDQLIYIKQYRVFEQLIFPASAYIEAGLSAAKSILNHPAFYIEKFNIESPLFPHQDQPIQLQVKPTSDDAYKITIFAEQEKQWHLFSNMEIQAAPPSPPTSITIDDLKSGFAESIGRSQVYDNFKKRALLCDAECQVIQEAYLKSDSLLAHIALTKTSHGHGYYYPPSLLDGVMQSALLLTDDEATYLPDTFERFTVFQEAARNLWAHVTQRPIETPDALCVDITLYDNTGLLIATMEALRLKRVTPRDFMSYDRALQHLYHTTWHPLDQAPTRVFDYPPLFVISNDPIKAKKRLGQLQYQLIQDLRSLDDIENKNILFLYEQGQFMDLFHCCQTLCKSYPARFILVTEQAYAISNQDEVNPYHTMASSFWKSFRNELDFNKNYMVDVDSNSTLAAALASIFNTDNRENQYAVRDTIYVPRLEKKELSLAQTTQETFFDSQATYLIVGGTGGLAKPLIDYLIQRRAKHITIISRSECSKETQNWIDQAAQKHVTIQHYAADASHYRPMEQIIQTIEKSPHRLKGIFHLAGIIQDGLIANLTDENIQQVFNAKMESALILHQLTQQRSLDFLVFFSSSASLLGGRGQSNYAAANGFLDGLAHLRQQQGKRTLSINWGPFHTVGMAANLTSALEQQGYLSLDQASLGIIDVLLEHQLTQISPCPMDWDLYFKHALKQPWLSTQVKPTRPQDQRFLHSLKEHSQSERVTILSDVLCEITADVLALESTEKISAHDHLFSLGVDSLMSLEIRHRIHDKLQCETLSISIDYFINDPSIHKIAQYITDELQLIFEDTTNRHSPENIAIKDVPLCDFQYLFWVLNKFGFSYNVGMQLQLHGPLNKDYVLQAFDFVVKKNDAFWISFSKDTLIQTLTKEGQFNLIYKDISLNHNDNTLQDEFHTNIMRIMPLAKPPLIRVYLYKINHDRHELHLIVPHIIVDIASCSLILSQFKTSYEALARGKTWIQTKTPEKNTFLNYVQHNNYHYEKNLNDKINFWRTYNKGFKKLGFSYTDHLPDAAVYQKKYLFHYTIPPQLMEPFIDWHKEKNKNISTGLIAACQLAFYNISHQKEMPILLIHSGREGSQYKSVVGLFAEYKRVNLRFNEKDTFIDCLTHIEDEFLKTAPYQKCPLPIKNIGLKRSRLSISRFALSTLNKLFLTKQFKKSNINATVIRFYLELLSQLDTNKTLFFIKYKLNQLFNLNIPLQQPHRLDVLISITPSFFIKELPDKHFADIEYTFSSHFDCLDRPIGNQALWIYFTKNQYGDYVLSINGPLTATCKDKIAAEFNKVIAACLEEKIPSYST